MRTRNSRKYKILLIISALVLITGIGSSWWNQSWEERDKIVISEKSGLARNREPITIKLDKSKKMKSDCSDIRIIQDNKEIPRTINTCNSTKVELIFPFNVSSSSNTIYYLYYGNNDASKGEEYSIDPLEWSDDNKYYFLDTYNYNTECASKNQNIWIYADCSGTHVQNGWFEDHGYTSESKRSSRIITGDGNDNTPFLVPYLNTNRKYVLPKITPQAEPDYTYTHYLPHDIVIKSVDFIASSAWGTGTYQASFNGEKVSYTLQEHCNAPSSNSDYSGNPSSHHISDTNPDGNPPWDYVFNDKGGCGETVQHLSYSFQSKNELSKFSVYEDSGGDEPRPLYWAFTFQRGDFSYTIKDADIRLCDYRVFNGQCLSNQTHKISDRNFKIDSIFKAENSAEFRSLFGQANITVSNSSFISGLWYGSFNITSQKTIIKPGASFKPENGNILIN